jgi:hypothetical protein
VDFFTFIIIAVFLYNIFSKKDKPPQRTQRRAEIPSKTLTPKPSGMDRKISGQDRKRKESIFESLERQLRESAERFEQELQGGRAESQKPAKTETSQRRTIPPKTLNTQGSMDYQETEGAWGDEGRSDYDEYISTQGTQGTEGVAGQEGAPYALKPKRKEHTEIGVSPIYPQTERLARNLGFSSSEIVQGIIWAEVLKEPKGRRGFSRR